MLHRCTRALPSALVFLVVVACTRAGGSADSPGIAPQPTTDSRPSTADNAAAHPTADDATATNSTSDDAAAANSTSDDATATDSTSDDAVDVGAASSTMASGAATATVAPADTSDLDPIIALGLATYRQQYCGICHTLDAAGTRGVFGPEHNGIGARAEQRIHDPDYTGTATTAAAYVRESIVTPEAYVVPGYEFTRHRMPPYTALDDAELDALVQMLLQQK